MTARRPRRLAGAGAALIVVVLCWRRCAGPTEEAEDEVVASAIDTATGAEVGAPSAPSAPSAPLGPAGGPEGSALQLRPGSDGVASGGVTTARNLRPAGGVVHGTVPATSQNAPSNVRGQSTRVAPVTDPPGATRRATGGDAVQPAGAAPVARDPSGGLAGNGPGAPSEAPATAEAPASASEGPAAAEAPASEAPSTSSEAAVSSEAAASAEAAEALPAEEATPTDVDAFLALTLNGVDQADVLVHLQPDGDLLVSEADLGSTGLRIDDAARVELRGLPFVSLRSLGADLEWSVDVAALTLDVVADPQRLPKRTLDMGASFRPQDIQYTSNTSAFFNYGVRTVDFQRIDGYGELGVSVKTARLYSGVSFPFQDVPVRGVSNVTVDLRRAMLRLTAGDAFANGGTLGGGAFMGGLQVARTYQLDPYFIPGPSLDHQTQVLLPSTLEVYVNGQLSRRTDVAPGPLSIQNIPMTSGAGDTRVVLRDALGRESVVTAGYYRPRGVLGKGQQEFSYSAGFLRNNIATESFDYGDIAAVGTHRYGLTRWLTGSVRAEASVDRFSGGLGAVLGTPVGQIEVAGAVSGMEHEAGGAASLAWSYSSKRGGASIYGRYLSDAYSTLSITPTTDRATVEAGASAGLPITPRWTASAAYAVTHLRDAGLGHRATLSTGYQLPKGFQIGAYGMWARSEAATDTFSVYASVTSTFGPRMNAIARGEFSSSGNNAFAEISRPTPVGNGAGFRVGGRVGDSDQVYAYANANAPFLRAQGAFDWHDNTASGSLGVSGGLIAIGGRLFANRPVESAFALVRVPGVKGVRAYINNNHVATTDRHGDAIVQGLLPYYGNRISISDVDVPLDHAISDAEKVVAPPERSGAVVLFPVHPLRLVRGHISVQGLNPAYGDVLVQMDGEPVLSPIGAGGAFELDGLTEGTWTGSAEFPGGSCALSLVVPAGDGAIIDLGDVVCTPHPTGAGS